MKKLTIILLLITFTIQASSCSQETKEPKGEQQPAPHTQNIAKEESIKTNEPTVYPSDQLPEGYVVYEKIAGDLNKDGKIDSIIIIKGTDPKMINEHPYRGNLDQNRRGIMIFFNENGKWPLITKNLEIFASENEDGGVYYAPELSVNADKNILTFRYEHGRYGHWEHKFRFNGKSYFELIGYDGSSNHGPYIDNQTSINFATKKLQFLENQVEDRDNDEPDFKEYWYSFTMPNKIYLSKIKDIDNLESSISDLTYDLHYEQKQNVNFNYNN